MIRGGMGLCATVLLLAASAIPSAQVGFGRETPRAGSWEVGGAATWTRGFSGVDRTAELTRNGELAGGFDLFTTDSRIGGGAGAGATLAFYLSRTVALEAGGRYSRPRLAVRLSGDAEDAAAVTAEETLTRYVFTGSVVLHLRRAAVAPRAVPFVAAGAGYIRELHQGNELIETGTEFHAAAGFKYWFGAARRRVGVRGEAGLSVRDGGFDFKDERRMLPMAAASLIYLF